MANFEPWLAFGIQLHEKKPRGECMLALLEKETCVLFLQQYQEAIGAPNVRVAASLFMKQYARFTAVPLLYSMARHNSALAVPLKACYFTNERTFSLHKYACKWTFCKNEQRAVWREQAISQLFGELITPFILSLHEATNVRTDILWENVAVRIRSLYRKAIHLEKQTNSEWQNDIHFLNQAEGQVFHWPHNPLKELLSLGVDHSNRHVRKTCCMNYRLKKAAKSTYCDVCPLNQNNVSP
ncbi:(2Fe-2S)-binding protein [Shouchella tritolerans]|uniref:(2Fe-2S)-binding protein n=1 Tax=Shouchella tritolerans TaxID=2979466 RepID=UPI0021E80A93|nr:(2Fe-2S)-binding protein [Shouchella tritolerans]